MLCDHLEGWDKEGAREEDSRGKRYGDICICITDSIGYKSETNTPLQSNYTPIKMLKKEKNLEAEFLWESLVFALKAFNWLEEAHPHYGGKCPLLKPIILNVKLLHSNI